MNSEDIVCLVNLNQKDKGKIKASNAFKEVKDLYYNNVFFDFDPNVSDMIENDRYINTNVDNIMEVAYVEN